ncbi:MAG: hypothetical protein QW461_10810 [Candidatus Jordarchaeales archaeon]
MRIKVMVFPKPLLDYELKMLYEGKLKPVRCRKCDCYFTSRSELMRHIWRVHK